jgi:hypothetical protein
MFPRCRPHRFQYSFMTFISGVVLANCRPDTDLVTNPAVNIFISLHFGNCLYVNKFKIEVVDLNNVHVN